MSNNIKLSVLITTYNSPKWLERTLWGYQCQSFSDFEIIIADDGSGEETKELINKFKQESDFPIQHVWQPDEGFQKTRILNKALEKVRSDYVVVSDGDCIPRKDFLAIHEEQKAPGYFLSGGYFKLPMTISNKIEKEHIESQQCFDVDWLLDNGLPKSFKNNKLKAEGNKEYLLNKLTPTKATWNGHNASGWLKDILAVNGFDERMQYGGLDRELGERLFNYGIKAKQIRYSAICVHLDHPRGYVTKETLEKNRAIRDETKKKRMKWTDYGIKKKS